MYIHFVGKLAPTAPILQFDTVLPSFPFTVKASVEKKIFPPLVVTPPRKEPNIELFVIRLFVAPPINSMVDVPEVADAVVLEIVKELPPVFKPFMVTLSAPFKLIKELPAVIAPLMVRAAPPFG
jgi:hypothetical protein